MSREKEKKRLKGWTRREFLKAILAAGGFSLSGALLFRQWDKYTGRHLPWQAPGSRPETFIAKAASYDEDLASIIFSVLAIYSGAITATRNDPDKRGAAIASAVIGAIVLFVLLYTGVSWLSEVETGYGTLVSLR